MKFSFEGVGQCCASFAGSGLREETVVKLTGSGIVGACAAGEDFCGVVAVTGRDGLACAVQLRGAVRVAYSGAAPGVGWVKLAADGDGGVKVLDSGRSVLVLEVDLTGKTATILL